MLLSAGVVQNVPTFAKHVEVCLPLYYYCVDQHMLELKYHEHIEFCCACHLSTTGNVRESGEIVRQKKKIIEKRKNERKKREELWDMTQYHLMFKCDCFFSNRM